MAEVPSSPVVACLTGLTIGGEATVTFVEAGQVNTTVTTSQNVVNATVAGPEAVSVSVTSPQVVNATVIVED